MKFTLLSLFVLTTFSGAEESRNLRRNGKKFRGRNGVCVIGCTPYVNPSAPGKGIEKYQALLADMADNCDLIVHVGDTKAGSAPCNKDIMTAPLHMLVNATMAKGKMALYAVGDNELNDCHRDGSKVPPRVTEFYKAADARAMLISEMKLDRNTDLTGVYEVESHSKTGIIPGTSKPYSCDFDKMAVGNDYIVVTIEFPGSHWYLLDQRLQGYPNQDSIDPLANRLAMYLNAKDCALEWITYAVEKAASLGKRAVFITFQAHYWEYDVYGSVNKHADSATWDGGIGEYYNKTNLAAMTKNLTGTAISEPFQPLYTHLTTLAKAYPGIMIYTVNADSHTWTNVRANSAVNNNPSISSNHNFMIHQVEGDGRALTMYTKFTVDADAFEPVQVEQVWSKAAYDTAPVGHAYYRYS